MDCCLKKNSTAEQEKKVQDIYLFDNICGGVSVFCRFAKHISTLNM